MKKAILLIFALLTPYGAPAQNPQPTPVVTQRTDNRQVTQGTFCDPNFVGEPITFMQTAELTLDDLLREIHNRFGVNFLAGPKVGDLPINIKTNSIPWNTLLNSQLFVLGVRSTCINSNTIQLVSNEEEVALEKGRQDAAALRTEFIKLKYLQPTTGGTRNLAGQSTNQGGGGQCGNSGGGNSGGSGSNIGGGSGGNQNCGTFEKLIYEIEKIVGLHDTQTALVSTDTVDRDDDSQTTLGRAKTVGVRRSGSVSQIPGRNILVVRATAEQLEQIRQIIALADRPPFQVVIKGLVYTANENRLRDIGVQTTITASTGNGRTSGGIFGAPISGAGTIFDFSTLIGTFDFNIQASALEQNGVISIKSRPFAVVLDGDPTALEVGRQIPVLTQGSIVGTGAGNLEFIGASNLLSVTPHVIDDDAGNPVAVNLELQLESNEVDLSVISQGVPSVTRRSIQSKLILNQDKTVILGGFTVDSNSNSVAKTPGLGDIPILGYLFKRKVRSDQINRLYFAISVSVIPYGQVVEPVVVPGATTDIPSITPDMLKRAKEAPTVVSPVKDKP
jgi:type II secretory pathway component GspD/PulD (secretin)